MTQAFITEDLGILLNLNLINISYERPVRAVQAAAPNISISEITLHKASSDE